MKKSQDLDSFYGIKGSKQFLLILFCIFFVFVTSCSKDEIEATLIEDSSDLKASFSTEATSTTIEEIVFTAVALIEHCHGENIRFTGTIQNRITKTTDSQGGIHYTRSFRTRGMTGIGLITGAEYDVLGGAEMFAIKDAVLNANGTLNLGESIAESDIVIHQGTLVFVNREDGSKVVARHIIKKIPGSETTVNEWRCGGN